MEPYFTKEVTKQKMETDSCVKEPEVTRFMDGLSEAVDMLNGAIASLEARLDVVMSPALPNKEELADQKISVSPLGIQLHKQVEIIKEHTATLNNVIKFCVNHKVRDMR